MSLIIYMLLFAYALGKFLTMNEYGDTNYQINTIPLEEGEILEARINDFLDMNFSVYMTFDAEDLNESLLDIVCRYVLFRPGGTI